MAFFQPDRNANSHRARQIRCQRRPPQPENLQVLEKLHERQRKYSANTNVTQITEENSGFAAFSIARSGSSGAIKHHYYQGKGVRPKGHSRGQNYVNEVAGFFVAG
jgi:hypothetical protein